MSFKLSKYSYIKKKSSFLYLALFAIVLLSCDPKKDKQQEGQESMPKSMMESDGMMHEDGMMEGDEMMSDEMREAMMSRGMDPEMMEDMKAIRKLLMNHEKIDRRVENLKNGVKTWTTSEDPEIAAAIQTHVRQMKERMEEKKLIRHMDPLFLELFDNAHKIQLEFEDLENGIMVTETSEDPQVVKLIQQHANKAVSEFAEQGMKRAMHPTPLPEGYQE